MHLTIFHIFGWTRGDKRRSRGAAASFSPRRASRGIRTAYEGRQPREGRHPGVLWAETYRRSLSRTFEWSRMSPLRGLSSRRSRSVPRLARRGLNDRARFAGLAARQVLRLMPMGRWPREQLFFIISLFGEHARRRRCRQHDPVGHFVTIGWLRVISRFITLLILLIEYIIVGLE